MPFGAGLAALRGGVTHAADLVPCCHRPDRLLVEEIGRGGERAGGRDGKRDVTVAALGDLQPRQPGYQTQVNIPARDQAADVAGKRGRGVEAAYSAGMAQGRALGHLPAHRVAEQVCRVQPSASSTATASSAMSSAL